MLVASTSVVGFGFRSGKLRTSKCLPICPRKRTSTDGTGMSAAMTGLHAPQQSTSLTRSTLSARTSSIGWDIEAERHHATRVHEGSNWRRRGM